MKLNILIVLFTFLSYSSIAQELASLKSNTPLIRSHYTHGANLNGLSKNNASLNSFTSSGQNYSGNLQQLSNSAFSGGMLFPYEAGVFEKTGDMKLGVYCSNSGLYTDGGSAIAFGYTNLTNQYGQFPGYEIQYGATSSSNFFVRFNSLSRNSAGLVTALSTTNELVINKGNLGINLGPSLGTPYFPTAKLHVNCGGAMVAGATSNIRFENLQQGGGNYLTIDANGYVHQSINFTTNRRSLEQQSNIDSLQSELIQVKSELAELKNKVQALLDSKK